MSDCKEMRLSRSGPGGDAATASCTCDNWDTECRQSVPGLSHLIDKVLTTVLLQTTNSKMLGEAHKSQLPENHLFCKMRISEGCST
jgi:hypothetical protein